MAPRDPSLTFVSRPLWLSCVAGLWLSACSSDASDSTASGAGTTTGTSSSGATTGGAATTGAGPTSNGTSMGAGNTVSSSSGNSTTAAGPTTTSAGNATSSGGSGGDGTVGAGGSSASGGTTGTSTGQVTSTGAGGTGGGVECTRELLSTRLDEYFVALAAGDPSTLALAANLKFTENAEETEIGTTEFWMDAGDVKHSQSALDTDQCMVAAQAVVPEGDLDLPIAVRIKLDGGEMSEIETIVVRPGDYTASFAVPSDPQAIIDIADEVGWHDVVPEGDQRASREQLTAWVDKYFRFFPQGVCNVTGECRRLENGGGNQTGSGPPGFGCNVGATCNAGDPGPNDDNLVPRLILADVERGITVGFTILEGHLDMHMAKMSGGSVHAVHAILRDTDGQSGWD